MTAAERISSLVILPSLVLITGAKLPSSAEVPSNNPSFRFPNSIVKATEPFHQGAFCKRATAKLKHFQRRSEDRGVLLLNETGGGVDLPGNCDKHS